MNKKIFLFTIAAFVWLCSGCRTVNYTETTYPDGRLEKNVNYFVFGLDTSIGTLDIQATRDQKSLKLSELDTKPTDVISKALDKIPNYGGMPTVIVPSNDPITRLPPVRPPTTSPVP